MLGADAAGRDVGAVVVFASDGRAREAAKHGKLADMVQRVGDRALKEFFGGLVERLGRGEVAVKGGDGGEKASDLLRPGERGRVVPSLLAPGEGESPVKEIAHMGEDLGWGARCFTEAECGKGFGGVAQGFAGAVGEGCDGVAEELALRIG